MNTKLLFKTFSVIVLLAVDHVAYAGAWGALVKSGIQVAQAGTTASADNLAKVFNDLRNFNVSSATDAPFKSVEEAPPYFFKEVWTGSEDLGTDGLIKLVKNFQQQSNNLDDYVKRFGEDLAAERFIEARVIKLVTSDLAIEPQGFPADLKRARIDPQAREAGIDYFPHEIDDLMYYKSELKARGLADLVADIDRKLSLQTIKREWSQRELDIFNLLPLQCKAN